MNSIVSSIASILPAWDQPHLKLGPLTLHLFGALVACAVLVGSWVIRRRAIKEGLDPEKIGRMVFWILVGGFIGAHLVDRFIYFPRETMADPITILKVWQGISSFGGFLGAAVAVMLFIRREKLGAEKWRYLDAIAYGFVFGWIFGRAGCFVAFDHPGGVSDFFLAQLHREIDDTYVGRHNLGLYECLYFAIVLAPLFWAVGKKRKKPGFYLGLICISYAPIRFMLDFSRIVDTHYFGLTPGQWGSIALVLLGIFFLFKRNAFASAEAKHLALADAGRPGGEVVESSRNQAGRKKRPNRT
jgi:phosphatidylglycerol:prolipoprotein diacylglycerol transferase